MVREKIFNKTHYDGRKVKEEIESHGKTEKDDS